MDRAAGALDHTVTAMAKGTDPEHLLHVRRTDELRPTWRRAGIHGSRRVRRSAS
jgi:hypothetical protein